MNVGIPVKKYPIFIAIFIYHTLILIRDQQRNWVLSFSKERIEWFSQEKASKVRGKLVTQYQFPNT